MRRSGMSLASISPCTSRIEPRCAGMFCLRIWIRFASSLNLSLRSTCRQTSRYEKVLNTSAMTQQTTTARILALRVMGALGLGLDSLRCARRGGTRASATAHRLVGDGLQLVPSRAILRRPAGALLGMHPHDGLASDRAPV